MGRGGRKWPPGGRWRLRVAERKSFAFRARLRKPRLLSAEGSARSLLSSRGPARSLPARASVGKVGSALDLRPSPGAAPRVPMATRVLTMSARLGPVPQPPAPQDEPVFAQLKPVLGAANPTRDAALFGEELKHPHHHPQAQSAPPHPQQPAPPPAAGPRLPPEELVQVGRAAPLPPGARACPAAATRGRQGPLQAGACVGAQGELERVGQPCPALLAWTLTFHRAKVGRPAEGFPRCESDPAGRSVKG